MPPVVKGLTLELRKKLAEVCPKTTELTFHINVVCVPAGYLASRLISFDNGHIAAFTVRS